MNKRMNEIIPCALLMGSEGLTPCSSCGKDERLPSPGPTLARTLVWPLTKALASQGGSPSGQEENQSPTPDGHGDVNPRPSSRLTWVTAGTEGTRAKVGSGV